MGTRIAAAVLVIVGGSLVAACGDDDNGGESSVAATCKIMATIEGGEDLDTAKLDELLAVAPSSIADDVRLVRDALAKDGLAAYDDPAVVEAIGTVGEFEEASCS